MITSTSITDVYGNSLHAWSRSLSTRTALYIHRVGAGHPHRWPAGGVADADRYLSDHRHPGDQRGMDVYRPPAGSDVRPGGLLLRARIDLDGQQHRAHRIAIAARRRGREDLLPAWHRYPHRHRSGHVDLPNRAQADAAGHHASADRQLQRLNRSHPATGTFQHQTLGIQDSRRRAEFRATSDGGGSRRHYSHALRRKDSPGHARPRSAGIVIAGTICPGRQRCPGRTEPDRSCGHGQDRHLRIQRAVERQPHRDCRSEQSADQDREWRDHHDRRCGPCP